MKATALCVLVLALATGCATTGESQITFETKQGFGRQLGNDSGGISFDGRSSTVGEWVTFVCNMPDPRARRESIAATEEQLRYTFECPSSGPITVQSVNLRDIMEKTAVTTRHQGG